MIMLFTGVSGSGKTHQVYDLVKLFSHIYVNRYFDGVYENWQYIDLGTGFKMIEKWSSIESHEFVKCAFVIEQANMDYEYKKYGQSENQRKRVRILHELGKENLVCLICECERELMVELSEIVNIRVICDGRGLQDF